MLINLQLTGKFRSSSTSSHVYFCNMAFDVLCFYYISCPDESS